MSLYNRVIWSEGLFLRPQHFQQLDRFHQHELRNHFGLRDAYRFGIATLQLDTELLKFAKLGLVGAAGVFEDGTRFDVPTEAPLPLPLDIPDGCKDALVCLVLPVRRPGMADVSLGDSKEVTASAMIRERAADQDVIDHIVERDSTAPMKVAQLNLTLELQDRVGPAFVSLPVARIVEKRPDGQVLLDDSFIPVSLDVQGSRRLRDMVREIHGLLRHRSIVLAERVAQPGSKGVAEFSDFLLLQVCNKFAPLFFHFTECAPLHPEALYREMLLLAGELSTFGRPDRRCPEFPVYRHSFPAQSFGPVVEEIRRTLTAVIEQTAVAIPLIDKGRGVRIGEINDVSLLRSATFVLAVYADVTTEQLRSGFPPQLKIGPAEKIRDLVMSHLPGIVIRALPVAPRQLPYHAGYTYFELDRASELWKGVETSRVLAMHVAGEFPGLIMEFWAIRER